MDRVSFRISLNQSFSRKFSLRVRSIWNPATRLTQGLFWIPTGCVRAAYKKKLFEPLGHTRLYEETGTFDVGMPVHGQLRLAVSIRVNAWRNMNDGFNSRNCTPQARQIEQVAHQDFFSRKQRNFRRIPNKTPQISMLLSECPYKGTTYEASPACH